MSLFEVVEGTLKVVPQGSFAAEGVRERGDIQQWIRKNPGVLGENLLVVAEEFGWWEDSKRRIDLLAIDEEANLVVIELKRTEDGGHMDLQAIRYAAMVSAMTFADVTSAYGRYLARHDPGKQDEAKSRLLQFLSEGEEEGVEIGSAPRIILVSADFSLEITTTVLWLLDRGLSIRCIQMVPYRAGEKTLLDLRQVIPLAQAGDYQVRLRQKEEANRQAAGQARRERSLNILLRHGVIQPGTEIEVVPASRLGDWEGKDEALFRATVGNPHVRAAFIWRYDGRSYSLVRLCQKLWDDGVLRGAGSNSYLLWRVIGHEENMCDEAERLRQAEPAANAEQAE